MNKFVIFNATYIRDHWSKVFNMVIMKNKTIVITKRNKIYGYLVAFKKDRLLEPHK